jgi:hypothetical protein
MERRICTHSKNGYLHPVYLKRSDDLKSAPSGEGVGLLLIYSHWKTYRKKYATARFDIF